MGNMFWKIYSVVLVAILLPTYVVVMGSTYSMWDFMDMAVTVGALMGFMGYAYKFRIISMTLWKVYFFLAIVWDIFYNIIITLVLNLAVHLPNEPKMGASGVLLSFAIVIPEYIALYLYGFQSESLWTGVS